MEKLHEDLKYQAEQLKKDIQELTHEKNELQFQL